jgi:DNA repair protein RadC
MAKRGRSHRRSRARARPARQPRLPRVRGVDDAAQVVKQLVCDDHTEGQLIIGLDESRSVCGAVFNCPCDGCRDEMLEDPVELVDLADAMRADDLVLVTFVPLGRLAPTAADVARFEGLRVECRDQGAMLLDHLLFSGHRWRSVAEVGLSAGGDPGASTTW